MRIVKEFELDYPTYESREVILLSQDVGDVLSKEVIQKIYETGKLDLLREIIDKENK